MVLVLGGIVLKIHTVLVFQAMGHPYPNSRAHPLTKSLRLEIQGAVLESILDLKFMLGIPTMTN